MGEENAPYELDERRSSLTDLISENPGFWLINRYAPYFILHRHESSEQDKRKGWGRGKGGATEREGVL